MNSSDEIVKLKYDKIFKMFICKKDNKKSLESLLSRILNIPKENINKIEIVNSELLPEEEDEKFGRIDVNLEVDGRRIDIEMQFNHEGSFRERTLYYWSKLYSGSLRSGEPYGVLPECVCINIINFDLFRCGDYHSRFNVLETTRHELLTNRLDIHFFELTKLGEKFDKNDPLRLWMQLINAETKGELDMLENTNVKEIQEAVLIIREMSADERTKEISRRREKRLHDEATAMDFARSEGIAIGKAEGLNEAIEKMRKSGMTEEQIKNILY